MYTDKTRLYNSLSLLSRAKLCGICKTYGIEAAHIENKSALIDTAIDCILFLTPVSENHK